MSAATEETTVSLNGGPQVPLSAFHEAVKRVVRRAPGKQRDLEDPDQLGTIPENDAKVAGIAADRLRSIIERYERLDEEVKALRSDQKDLMAEAGSSGFHVGALRAVIRRRAQLAKDAAKVREQDELFELYLAALS